MTINSIGPNTPPPKSNHTNALNHSDPRSPMVQGVYKSPLRGLSEAQLDAFPGAVLQHRAIVRPSFNMVPAYELSSSPVPNSQIKTPLTQSSKQKLDEMPEMKEAVKNLILDFDGSVKDSDKIGQVKIKNSKNKQAFKTAQGMLHQLAKENLAAQISTNPSHVFGASGKSFCTHLAQCLVDGADKDHKINSIGNQQLDSPNSNPHAVADRLLLNQSLEELVPGFTPDENLPIKNLWGFLQGADFLEGNEKQRDRRNFLITVVKFDDNTELKFFSVSGTPNLESGQQDASYNMLGRGPGNEAAVVKVPLLPIQPETGKTTLEANLGYLEPKENAKFIHLSYSDVSTYVDEQLMEIRESPRLLILRPQPGDHHVVLDRARDTEYTVLNSLSVIAKTYPERFKVGFEIVMFSKLQMCPSCTGSAVYFRNTKEFEKMKGLRIYGGD